VALEGRDHDQPLEARAAADVVEQHIQDLAQRRRQQVGAYGVWNAVGGNRSGSHG
jgi:hypothetical protein